MAGKIKKTELIKKTDFSGKDSRVLIEQINSNINRLIDGQIDLSEKVGLTNDRVKELETEIRDGFAGVWREVGSFKDETRANFKELFEFRDETRANFKQIFDYLSSMDDELEDIKAQITQFDETKIDKQKFVLLENRIIKLERELEEFKNLVKERK